MMTIQGMKIEYRGLWLEQLKDVLQSSEVLLAEEQRDRQAILEGLTDVFSVQDCLTDTLINMENFPDGRTMKCNTYPFGQKTNDIYPLLIATCSENQQLARLLKYMIRHGIRFNDKLKTMILFTVKWDLKVFRRFKLDLLRLSLVYGIDIMFILVTDYGFTEIPFREICQKLRNSNNMLDLQDVEFESIESNSLFASDPIVEYTSHPGTWRMNDPGQCVYIDLKKCKYYRGPEMPFGVDEALMIDFAPNKIRRFISNTQFVKLWKENYDDSYIMDAGHWSLHIYGKEYKGQVTKPKDFDLFWEAVDELID